VSRPLYRTNLKHTCVSSAGEGLSRSLANWRDANDVASRPASDLKLTPVQVGAFGMQLTTFMIHRFRSLPIDATRPDTGQHALESSYPRPSFVELERQMGRSCSFGNASLEPQLPRKGRFKFPAGALWISVNIEWLIIYLELPLG